jgi:hypothetical protein
MRPIGTEQWIIEDQAFSPPYDFSPPPPPFSRYPLESWTMDSGHGGGKTAKEGVLADGRGVWREGEGAKPCDGEKAWYSINHSIFSG